MDNKEKQFSLSWFFRWFLDNKAITVFLVTLLLGLNLLVLSKITFIFIPIFEFAFVFFLIAVLLIWGLAVVIPSVQRQVVSFFHNLPTYLEKANATIDDFLDNRVSSDIKPQLDEITKELSANITSWASSISGRAVNWVSNLIGVASQVIVAFYLLRDGKNLKGHIVRFLPTKIRKSAEQVLSDVNTQLSNYVRGQITVAIVVAIMFIIFFKIIGLRYAVTLGISAGILNLIPYLGSFLAMLPALVLGLVAGPEMFIKVLIVFAVEQTIEGRFVSPLVLGSQLNIHPITILFVLLTSGSMFGIWGVFLGIPVYASAKVVIGAIFEWYKVVSGLYEEHNEIEEETHSES